MNIREFYLANYPTDELGVELNPEATFISYDFVYRLWINN
jgi:hypothetical protein